MQKGNLSSRSRQFAPQFAPKRSITISRRMKPPPSHQPNLFLSPTLNYLLSRNATKPILSTDRKTIYILRPSPKENRMRKLSPRINPQKKIQSPRISKPVPTVEVKPILKKWEKIKFLGNVPHQLISHSLCFKDDVLYIFCGEWGLFYKVLLDCLKWEQIKVQNAPSIRSGHSCCMRNSEMFIIGGFFYPKYYSDVHKFNFQEWKWELIETHGESPQGRQYHSSVIYKNNIYIFGGEGENAATFNDLWMLNLESKYWKLIQTNGTSPMPRIRHASCIVGNFFIVFGGAYKNRQYFNDLFALNLTTNEWVELKTKGDIPSKRCGHSLTLKDETLILFGGFDGTDYLNDFYFLNLGTLFWTKIVRNNSPNGRYSHSTFINGNSFYVFGGSSGYGGLNDLYKTVLV